VSSDRLDIVTKVIEPKLDEFVDDRLGLLGEGGDEMAACETSAVSDGPGCILEALEQSRQHRGDERLERLLVDSLGNLGTELRDAVACSFSDGMIVSLRL